MAKKKNNKSAKVLEFSKEESNVVSLDAARERRKRRGMSAEEFQKKYMKNSIVSLYGKDAMNILNNHPEQDNGNDDEPTPA